MVSLMGVSVTYGTLHMGGCEYALSATTIVCTNMSFCGTIL